MLKPIDENYEIAAYAFPNPQVIMSDPNKIRRVVSRYRDEYLKARYLSITTDPCTGNEVRIENPNYLNRAERIALEKAKRDPFYGKTKEEIATIKAKEKREQQKKQRTKAVDSIIVTISTGKTFDGDELAQSRMARTIAAIEIAGVTDAFWTLANNETVPVTIEELKEAIVLSIQRMAELWSLEKYDG